MPPINKAHPRRLPLIVVLALMALLGAGGLPLAASASAHRAPHLRSGSVHTELAVYRWTRHTHKPWPHQTWSSSPTPTSTPTPTSSPTPTTSTTPTPTPTPTSSAPPPPSTSTSTPTSTPTSPAPAPTGGCAPKPSACGYPDATNTGVQAGVALTPVSGNVTITQAGAVYENKLVSGNIDVEANNVTIRNVRIVESGDVWGIGLHHTSGTTIQNVEIARGSSSRLEVGIKDVYGDATGTRILSTDISGTDTGIQTHEGLVQDNYVHDMAMNTGDHVNGFTSNGSTVPLTIRHNTMFNQISQTDAISLFQDFGVEGNRVIDDNLIAGGGYTLYGGAGSKGSSYNIVVTNNRFATTYFPQAGSYGPVAYFDRSGSGNVWSGNVWDGTGAALSAG